MPSKLKMGVCGCPNSCAEPAIKDIGIMGTAKGYNLMVGGSAAASPRLAEVVAKALSEDEVLDAVDRIITFQQKFRYKKEARKII